MRDREHRAIRDYQGDTSAAKLRRRGAVVTPCLSNTPQARCHASPETSRAPTSPVWSSRGFAETARRSHVRAARRPRCDGPTLPSSDLAFEGLGLLFANRSTATILALAIIEGVGTKEVGCRDGRVWSL